MIHIKEDAFDELNLMIQIAKAGLKVMLLGSNARLSRFKSDWWHNIFKLSNY